MKSWSFVCFLFEVAKSSAHWVGRVVNHFIVNFRSYLFIGYKSFVSLYTVRSFPIMYLVYSVS